MLLYKATVIREDLEGVPLWGDSVLGETFLADLDAWEKLTFVFHEGGGDRKVEVWAVMMYDQMEMESLGWIPRDFLDIRLTS